MADDVTYANLWERWEQTEPLRLHLYGITVPLLGVALAYGWVTTEQMGAWLAVAAALFLGTTMAGELARRHVWAPASVDESRRDAYARGVQDALHVTPDEDEGAERLETRELAVTRTGRCREVDGGRRCALRRHAREEPHLYG